MKVNIIGAGFAGVEASNYLAGKGFKVTLYEMRDKVKTPAHNTALFAELVCSNSFKSTSAENAHGLLKKEMQIMGAIVIDEAYRSSVPAGGALAVDRGKFSKAVTDRIQNNSNIEFIRDEIYDLRKLINADDILIICSGPLTSDKLMKSISTLIDKDQLYFYDAVSPIVDADTIDMDKVFFASRYDKGDADYLNAPFYKDAYYEFVEEIKNAEKAKINNFEKKKVFEGCMPVEVLAERGKDTLSFGPMKPVGLIDPKTNKRPFAVVQLRSENTNRTMFNLVGFQTRLKWNEQKRIFRMIPGLEKAEFLRFGVMHKNSYINLPEVIDVASYSINNNNNIYFAGQITGVEGYMESAASGLYTAYSIWAKYNNKQILFPENTMMGSLQRYTMTTNKDYQPIASNFGLLNKDVFNEKGKRLKGRDKKQILSQEAIEIMENFVNSEL